MKNKLIAFVVVFVVCILRAADKDLTAWNEASSLQGERLPFDWKTAGPRWFYGGLVGAMGGGAIASVLPE